MRRLLGVISIFILCLSGCTQEPATETTSVPDQMSQPGTESAETQATVAAGPALETTATGLKYRILRAGAEKRPVAASMVQVHYRGWLPDPQNPAQGTQFDSSYDRGTPAVFPLNAVIPGWTEGLQLVGQGGEIELEIPPHLAYGEHGVPGIIPGNGLQPLARTSSPSIRSRPTATTT